jgi:hypothetical protein
MYQETEKMAWALSQLHPFGADYLMLSVAYDLH